MNTTESKKYFSRLTKSTIIFFASFTLMAFVDQTNHQSIHLASFIVVITSHLAPIFLISSFVTSVGKSGTKYALGAFLVPFWGDGIVYFLCRNIAVEKRLI